MTKKQESGNDLIGRALAAVVLVAMVMGLVGILLSTIFNHREFKIVMEATAQATANSPTATVPPTTFPTETPEPTALLEPTATGEPTVTATPTGEAVPDDVAVENTVASLRVGESGWVWMTNAACVDNDRRAWVSAWARASTENDDYRRIERYALVTRTREGVELDISTLRYPLQAESDCPNDHMVPLLFSEGE